MAASHFTLEFTFGVLGNIISCFVCLSPLPTFYQICKKKSSEGFQCIPYVISLFSAMLWLFYAIFEDDATLLITINSFAFFVQITYLVVYLVYASKKDRIFAIKLLLLTNVFGFGMISGLTFFLSHGKTRVDILGWICMIFALCVFAAPLGILRRVIKTKSVEFMPLYLSLFLTVSAVMWFFYGFFKKDLFVAVPNILGFFLGVLQMILYVTYTRKQKEAAAMAETKVKELAEESSKMGKLSETSVCSDLNIVMPQLKEVMEQIKPEVDPSDKV